MMTKHFEQRLLLIAMVVLIMATVLLVAHFGGAMQLIGPAPMPVPAPLGF